MARPSPPKTDGAARAPAGVLDPLGNNEEIFTCSFYIFFNFEETSKSRRSKSLLTRIQHLVSFLNMPPLEKNILCNFCAGFLEVSAVSAQQYQLNCLFTNRHNNYKQK